MSYNKEYGTDTMQIHRDALCADDVVLIHDDLLATGGTAMAAYKLVQYFHPKKTYVNFIVEITDEGLHGRDQFKDIEMTTLLVI
jgi:adenine phosphoribosyltransferase